MKVISALTLFLLTHDVSAVKLALREDEDPPVGDPGAPPELHGPPPMPMEDVTTEELGGTDFFEGEIWGDQQKAVDMDAVKKTIGHWTVSDDTPQGHPQIPHSYELHKYPEFNSH